LYARKWGRPGTLRAALGAASVANLLVNVARQAAARRVDALATFKQELSYLRASK
jgi:hypothetical protein